MRRSAKGIERNGWMRRQERYDHNERRRLRESGVRFKWLCGGRRSGKTEDSMDHILVGHGPIDPKTGLHKFRGALTVDGRVQDPTFVIALPTYSMFRKVWWQKLKRRVPRRYVANISETHMEIHYVNGARIFGLGLDNAQRVEGIPVDGAIVDEFAYVKENAWKRSLRPALSTRGRPPGWAILQGKPAGRNHFYKGWSRALNNGVRNHDSFHWKSSVIMSPREIAQARIDNDPVSFRQEYEASFESYSGLAYHTFGAHNLTRAEYDPEKPLAFTWDFGTAPGTVVVAQMHDLPSTHCQECGEPRPVDVDEGDSWICPLCSILTYALMPCLVVIDEVYQLTGSTTRSLCEELVVKWASKIRKHSPVYLYGDPAGYSSSTRSISSDWDEIMRILGNHFADVRLNVPVAQPPQRDRVNALLRLCESDAGMVRLYVNRHNAPHTWEDFENTVLKEDGSGKIDKLAAGGLYSHLTDAVAYLALREFPRVHESIDSEVVGT